MADFSARAETELAIDDTYMEDNFANQDAVIDCVSRTPAAAFADQHLTVPGVCSNGFQIRAVSIDYARGDQGDVDTTATYGVLNRCLHNHQQGQQHIRRYAVGVTHPQGVRYIYPYQSTARGISVYC